MRISPFIGVCLLLFVFSARATFEEPGEGEGDEQPQPNFDPTTCKFRGETEGKWGDLCNPDDADVEAACLRDNHWDDIFFPENKLVIGCTREVCPLKVKSNPCKNFSRGKTLTFTNPHAFEFFLPQIGKPDQLQSSASNPSGEFSQDPNVPERKTAAGNFASQVAALGLSLAYDEWNKNQQGSDCPSIGDLLICDGPIVRPDLQFCRSSPEAEECRILGRPKNGDENCFNFRGYTIREIYEWSNRVLGGCCNPPKKGTISDWRDTRFVCKTDYLNECLALINQEFVFGKTLSQTKGNGKLFAIDQCISGTECAPSVDGWTATVTTPSGEEMVSVPIVSIQTNPKDFWQYQDAASQNSEWVEGNQNQVRLTILEYEDQFYLATLYNTPSSPSQFSFLEKLLWATASTEVAFESLDNFLNPKFVVKDDPDNIYTFSTEDQQVKYFTNNKWRLWRTDGYVLGPFGAGACFTWTLKKGFWQTYLTSLDFNGKKYATESILLGLIGKEISVRFCRNCPGKRCPDPNQTNLIRLGNFETPVFDTCKQSWCGVAEPSNSPHYLADIPFWDQSHVDIVTAGYAFQDKWAVDLTARAPGYISQTVTVPYDSDCRLSWWLSSNGGPWANGLTVTVTGASSPIQSTFSSPGSASFSEPFIDHILVPNGGPVTVRFASNVQGSAGPIVDNIYLVCSSSIYCGRKQVENDDDDDDGDD